MGLAEQSGLLRASDLERVMFLRGWREEDMRGDSVFFQQGNDWCVVIDLLGEGWELKRFTDSDIRGVAVGRYVNETEGETPEELRAALLERGL